MRDRAVRTGTIVLATAAVVGAVQAARRRRRTWVASGRYEYRALTETFELPVLRERVYWLLREPARAARLIDPDALVEPLDDTRSRWSLAGPDGTRVRCLVEVIGDVPEMQISWSVPDGPLPHEGRVELDPAAVGTAVRVRVRYAWSDRLGLADEDPARVLRRAVERLRAIAAEPSVSGQPGG
jgi:uncharacterized membrane protein